MSIETPHTYRGFNIRHDELTEPMTLVGRKATWLALEQLETGSEEVAAQRYQVKARAKFTDDEHKLESHHATKHEADKRARELKDAGYDTEIVAPTEAAAPPVSLARYRVEQQLNSSAPFARESTWADEGEAQVRAHELLDKGFGARIVDSNSGQVMQLRDPGGLATVYDADENTMWKGNTMWTAPEKNVQEVPGASGIPTERIDGKEWQVGTIPPSALPEHPTVTAPPETAKEEWLRKEKEAKEHPVA
jgi:hypothetical protein